MRRNSQLRYSISAILVGQITPLTKLGELGSDLVHNCVLKSKTEVQVNSNFKSCYSDKGSTKKKTSNLVHR